MKKHQLIKNAYDKYPKGTMFTWGGNVITSGGKFHFNDGYLVTKDKDEEFVVFDGEKWAEIVTEQLEKPKSILDGKVVVCVRNLREQDLFNKHQFEVCKSESIFPHWLTCDNSGWYQSNESAQLDGYVIISFANFAKEKNIEAPIFICKSEDHVDIYEKDYVCTVHIKDKRIGNSQWMAKKYCIDHNTYKYFSKKESAEKWIAENSNPSKELIFNRFLKATIDNSGVLIENTATGMKQLIFKSEMNKIIEYYESF